MGTYKKNVTASKLDSIASTALDMTTVPISYTFVSLLKHNVTSTVVNNIAISNITAARCDGFVEYAYEANSVILRGGNISTVTGAEGDNAMSAIFTPSHQAGKMTKVTN